MTAATRPALYSDPIRERWRRPRFRGELVGAKQVRPHELLGPSIRGAVEKKLKAGDVIHIPARTPHQMLVASGQQVTYLVVKVNVP